jgi:hypothetical protein
MSRIAAIVFSEGESKEFVSIETKNNIEGRAIELAQKEYWVKAVARFTQFLPAEGPAQIRVPLSPADEKLLIEPMEGEMKVGEHLPYASLLGYANTPLLSLAWRPDMLWLCLAAIGQNGK